MLGKANALLLLLGSLCMVAVANAASKTIEDANRMEREFHEVGETDVIKIFDKERRLGTKLGQCLERLKAAEETGASHQLGRNEFSRLLAPQVKSCLGPATHLLTSFSRTGS